MLMDPGNGQNWVATGPETEVDGFVGGVDHIGAPPPGQPGPDYNVYMRQRRMFHEALEIVPEAEFVRESDGLGGPLNAIGSESYVTSQIR